jgi:hypothetical protein
MQQFLHFAKQTGLLSEKHGGMIGSDVDRIFLRSVRPPAEGESNPHSVAVQDAMAEIEVGDAEAQAKVSAPAAAVEWAKARGAVKTGTIKVAGKNMLQHHFVGGLVRLANLRFASRPSLMDRLDTMCSEFLTRHVIDELDLLHDAFSKLIGLQPYLAVYQRRKASLERVFAVYAAADKSLGAVSASSTMNIREMSEFCDECKLFDGGKVSQRDMINAFSRVNIEDDVYVQSDKANTSTELTYDEFFEVLARMHHAREGGEKRRKARSILEEDEGLDLARKFDAWIEGGLLPVAAEAIKARKKKTG